MFQPSTPTITSPEGTPLLVTKLVRPARRKRLVARPQLVERLDAGLERTLTLLCAPEIGRAHV
jgi:ATP/maltotriose-dependent transcriptional regulator MalT